MLPKKESVLVLTDESEIIKTLNEFFMNHSSIDVNWNSMDGVLDIVKGKYSVIIVGAENNNGSFDHVFDNIKIIRENDPIAMLILATGDDSIIKDPRFLAFNIDDFILLPSKIHFFGFRILVNISRYRRDRVQSDADKQIKEKYDRSLQKLYALLK